MAILINENQLKSGEILTFTTKDEDDLRIAEVFHVSDSKNSWRNGFKIMFNGKLIHSSKTFGSLVKRLDLLIEKWGLV